MADRNIPSKTVTDIAWRIVNSAMDTAESALIHRQLIGELREALQVETSVCLHPWYAIDLRHEDGVRCLACKKVIERAPEKAAAPRYETICGTCRQEHRLGTYYNHNFVARTAEKTEACLKDGSCLVSSVIADWCEPCRRRAGHPRT